MNQIRRRTLLGSPALLAFAAAAGLRPVGKKPQVAASPQPAVAETVSATFERTDAPVCHCPLCMARVAQGLPRLHAVPVG